MNTTLTCILLFLFSFANAQSWDWAKSIGDVSYSEADGVTTDKQGNIYVTGSFRAPTITFGTFTLTNADQSTNQNQDIFVVKYNASGTALWAKRAGNSNMDWSISITTDKNDNVYVLGQYMGAISFDGITLPTSTTLTMFVVKYSSSGLVIWAKASTGGWIYPSSISVDLNENIFVAGGFNTSVSFDSITVTNPSSSMTDLFLAKYNSIGKISWVKYGGGTDSDQINDITVDAAGNIYASGSFRSSSITFGSTTLTSKGKTDIFTTKYNSSGEVVWATSEGSSETESGGSISADSAGNTYTAGTYTIPFTLGSYLLKGNYGSYLLKKDKDGVVLWAKNIEVYTAKSSALDNYGNCYVSGSIHSIARDTLLQVFDKNGALRSSLKSGGTPYPYSTAVDIAGNCYLAGTFISEATFGSTKLTALAGIQPVLLAKAVFSGVVGINNYLPKQNSIRIYPNPSSGTYTISLDKEIVNGEVNVFNIAGIKVHTETFDGQNKTINCNLSPGVYFVQVRDVDDNLITKIIRN